MTPLERWLESLQTRYLADLRFADVSRALRALSSTYVERRRRLDEGAAFAGAGKRAAYALFYGPIHYLLVERIIRNLSGPVGVPFVVDLGCGTGAAGAAWGTACVPAPAVLGIDRHPWAVEQAARTYRAFGLGARVRRADLAGAVLPKGPAGFITAFALNELSNDARDRLLARLWDRAARGDRVLIVEPIAAGAAPWWPKWCERVAGAGGRADEWRFDVELPPIVAKLDRAAGLDHRELTGRSLWIG